MLNITFNSHLDVKFCQDYNVGLFCFKSQLLWH